LAFIVLIEHPRSQPHQITIMAANNGNKIAMIALKQMKRKKLVVL
jgi:hypothetical protein